MASGYRQQGSSGSLSKDTVTHALPVYGVALLQRLNLLRRHSAFCDVIIHVEEKRFPAHRSVLAAACPKMYELLESLQPEPGNNYSTLHLMTLSSIGVEYILDSIYTGSLEFKKSHLHDVRAVAKYFELNDIVRICNSHNEQSVKDDSHSTKVDDQFNTLSDYGGHSDSTNYLNFYLDKLSHSVSDYLDTSKIQTGDLDFDEYGIGDSAQISGKSENTTDLLGTEVMSEYDYMQLLDLQYVGNHSGTSQTGESHGSETPGSLPVLRPNEAVVSSSKDSDNGHISSKYAATHQPEQAVLPKDNDDSDAKRQRLPGLMELFRASQKNSKVTLGSQRRSLLAPVSPIHADSLCSSLQSQSMLPPIAQERSKPMDNDGETEERLNELPITDHLQSQSSNAKVLPQPQVTMTEVLFQSAATNQTESTFQSVSLESKPIQTAVISESNDVYLSTGLPSSLPSAPSHSLHSVGSSLPCTSVSVLPQQSQSNLTSMSYIRSSSHLSSSCVPDFRQSSTSYRSHSMHTNTSHPSSFTRSSLPHPSLSTQAPSLPFAGASVPAQSHSIATPGQHQSSSDDNFLASYLPHHNQAVVASTQSPYPTPFPGVGTDNHYQSHQDQNHSVQTPMNYQHQTMEATDSRLTQSFQSLVSHQPLYLQSSISDKQYSNNTSSALTYSQESSVSQHTLQPSMVHHDNTYLASATSSGFSSFPAQFTSETSEELMQMANKVADQTSLKPLEQNIVAPNRVDPNKQGRQEKMATINPSNQNSEVTYKNVPDTVSVDSSIAAAKLIDLDYSLTVGMESELQGNQQLPVKQVISSCGDTGITESDCQSIRKTTVKQPKGKFQDATAGGSNDSSKPVEISQKQQNYRKGRSTELVHCSKCARSFRSERMLKAHEEKHDSQAMMLSCSICYQTFARASELTSHLHWHSDTVFTCTFCNLDIKDPKKYKQHMVAMHGEKKCFKCSYPNCQFRSDKYSRIQTHSTTHSSLRMYTCSRCNKGFRQADGLRHHTRCCQQRRSYLCDHCGSKFNRLDALRRHKLRHSGLKPYTCNACTSSFNSKVNLKRHQRIHKNIQPYSCNLCRRKFRHSNTLKSHVRRCQRDLEKRQVKHNVSSYPPHLTYHHTPHPHYPLPPKQNSRQQGIPPVPHPESQQPLPPQDEVHNPVTSQPATSSETIVPPTSSTDWSLYFPLNYDHSDYL